MDPCSGQGSLLTPWEEVGYRTWSNDLDPNSIADDNVDFLTLTDIGEPTKKEKLLILCNPPFNGAKPKLAPEMQSVYNASIALGQLWLDKIIELFGKDAPIVFFALIGLRICNSIKGTRYQKFINGHYPPITSIISFPRAIFTNVEFHTEILIFNIPNLQPHYFYE
jgi:hypothetical protein